MTSSTNEPTETDMQALLGAVASYIEMQVLADPRYRADMTDLEIADLALSILHENHDQAPPIEALVKAEMERVGIVPVLKEQERGRG